MVGDGSVCILGLGLIGGSLLRAAVSVGREAFGYNRSPQTVEAARADGYDADTDLIAVLDRATAAGSLIVLATPVTAAGPMLDAIAEHASDAPLTDVISVKAQVASMVAERGLTARFVGGHPMAGTAVSGWGATDPELFRGATWAVATDDDADPQVWSAVADLALEVGSVVVPVGTDAHDAAVAAISHLPHLTAAATAAVGGQAGDLALRLAAGSFRDGTRVAGTAPALQRAMLEANRESLAAALDQTIELLAAARTELTEAGTVAGLVEAGHTARLRYDQIAGAGAPSITVAVGSDDWPRRMRIEAQRGSVWRGAQMRSARPE
ncbi:prephenate dehydrogenase [Williamsia sp. CHRR-6]|uniref:prephenate dehydrogenase n=1 Tax=Williamsia sp. CHRR-6 TaxID=2835871 RepID=UPI001BDB5612|nr:prephenate dehydrogenase [Williamsia sp. CHRR-6]MBT0567386.1 prephenate dehydrogenase [Williamsia sp. CHRR-6]